MLFVVFMLFLGFYLMRLVQITNTMNVGLLKKKRLLRRQGNPKHLKVVGP